MRSLIIIAFICGAVLAICSALPLSIKQEHKAVIHKAGSHPGALVDHKEDPSCIGMMNWGRPATTAAPADGGGAAEGGDAEVAPARLTARRAGSGRSTTNTNTRTRRRQTGK